MKLIATLAKTDVLILDDWGLATLSDENCQDLLEDRYDLPHHARHEPTLR